MKQLIQILFIGVVLRILPILYSTQFENILQHQLKMTDIDYKVYTDAALYQSPYDRHTYRYTPILAYFMKFNAQVQCSGKLIFVIFDCLAILGIWKLMKPNYRSAVTKLYAYNPLFIYLTARGSCQSISMALMYWCFYFIFRQNGNYRLENQLSKFVNINSGYNLNVIIGYTLYGLWVHFRIYPIIFLPVLIVNEFYLSKKTQQSFILNFVKLGAVSGLTFLGLSAYFYNIYGMKFIQQTYLYHLTRLDNRHSFSPIFYEIYLSLNAQTGMKAFVRNLPQIYVIYISSKKLHNQITPFYAIFLITYAFVNFNKVITMQYYMWMWGALIILLPESTLSTNSQRRYKIAFNLTIQWVLGILVWVWLSNKLQKDGDNVFNFMWVICTIKLFWDLWVVLGFLQTIKNSLGYEPVKQK